MPHAPVLPGMQQNLEERIDRIHDLAGPGIEAEDLPDGEVDPAVYYTDDREWNHAKQMEHLLAVRGPAKVASHALSELDDVEGNVSALENNYLQLYEWAVEGKDITEEEEWHLERVAEQVRDGDGFVDGVDPSYFTAVKTALVVLGELTDVADASDTDNTDA